MAAKAGGNQPENKGGLTFLWVGCAGPYLPMLSRAVRDSEKIEDQWTDIEGRRAGATARKSFWRHHHRGYSGNQINRGSHSSWQEWETINSLQINLVY